MLDDVQFQYILSVQVETIKPKTSSQTSPSTNRTSAEITSSIVQSNVVNGTSSQRSSSVSPRRTTFESSTKVSRTSDFPEITEGSLWNGHRTVSSTRIEKVENKPTFYSEFRTEVKSKSQTSPLRRKPSNENNNNNNNTSHTQATALHDGKSERFRKTTEKSSQYKVDKRETSHETYTQSIELPTDGWTLKDAIKNKLFHPESGMFVAPGSGKEISFKDCLRLNIINPLSATVIEPNKSPQHTLSLKRAMDRGILDDNGNYYTDRILKRKVTMEEALNRKFINLDERMKSGKLKTRVLRIIKTDGSPGCLELLDQPIHVDLPKADHYQTSTSYEEFVELCPNIFYSPASDTVINDQTGEKCSLSEAFDRNLVDINLFSIINPENGQLMTIDEACDKGIWDLKNYEYKDSKANKRYSLIECIRRNKIVVTTQPKLLEESLNASIKHDFKEEPLPSSSQTTAKPYPSSTASSSQHKLGEQGSKVVRETVQVLKSREIFIKDPKSGKELPLDEALKKGIIDTEQAERIKNRDENSSGFSVQRSIDLTIHDPRTGRALPLDVALKRGIIDEQTAERIKRGDIIENVIKTNVTVIDDERENWSDIVSEINERLDQIQEFKQFQENYEIMKHWLDEMEKKIKLMACLSCDCKILNSQIEEVIRYQEEFKSRENTLKIVKDCGHSCQKRMDKSSIERNRIDKLIEALTNQWNRCIKVLEKRESDINKVLKTAKNYDIKMSKVENNLQEINYEYKCLYESKLEIDQKCKKCTTLEDKLHRQGALIGECEAICEHFCQLMNDINDKKDTTAYNIIQSRRNKMEQQYKQLEENLRSLRLSFDEVNDFIENSSKFSKWQEDINKMLLKEMNISTNERKIEEEMKKFGPLLQEIERQEYHFNDLMKAGKNIIDNMRETIESERIHNILDTIDRKWELMKNEIEKKVNKLDNCLQECRKIRSVINKCKVWLDECEVDISNWQEIMDDKRIIEKHLKEINTFKQQIYHHEKDFERLSEITLSSFNRDINDIREEINNIKKRWSHIKELVEKRDDLINNALDKLTKYQALYNETQNSIKKLDERNTIISKQLSSAASLSTSATGIDEKLVDKMNNLQEEIKNVSKLMEQTQQASLEFCRIINNESNNGRIEKSFHTLKEHYTNIKKQIDEYQQSIRIASTALNNYQDKIDSLNNQLNKMESKLNKLTSFGEDINTLEKQLNEIKELSSEITKHSDTSEDIKHKLKEDQSSTWGKLFEYNIRNMMYLLTSLDTRRENLEKNLNERKLRIDERLHQFIEYEESLKEFEEWLSNTERSLAKIENIGYTIKNLEKQMIDIKYIEDDINDKKSTMHNLESKAPKSQSKIISTIKHRWDKLTSKCIEKSKILEKNYKLSKEFFNDWKSLMDWLLVKEEEIDDSSNIGISVEKIKYHLNKMKALKSEFDDKYSFYENLLSTSKYIKDKTIKEDVASFQNMYDKLKEKWTSSVDKVIKTIKHLNKSLSLCDEYKCLIDNLNEWIKSYTMSYSNIHGDCETVQKLIKQHRVFQMDLKSKHEHFNNLKKIVEECISISNMEEAKEINKDIHKIEEKLCSLDQYSQIKENKLKESLKLAKEFNDNINDLCEWLATIESRILSIDLKEDQDYLEKKLNELNKIKDELNRKESHKEDIIANGQNILLDCIQESEIIIKNMIKKLTNKWDNIISLIDSKDNKIKQYLNDIGDEMDKLDEIIHWLRKQESTAQNISISMIPLTSEEIKNEISSLNDFMNKIKERESEINLIGKTYSKQDLYGKHLHLDALNILPDSIINSKARMIIEKWQAIWRLLKEKMKKLKDRLNQLSNEEKLYKFDFDEWRERFNDWISASKIKLMDFYRDIDRDHDNKVTYYDFIEAFLSSKFPTTRFEMEKVVTYFDHNNDNLIDDKEFIDTLRGKSEQEIIQDELQKHVAQCTCLNKYKVAEVGEGKFMFGESQKLRLVRILRSVVMVRVGGGWVSLCEFLIKNDPCRARGRTNVELREPLAEGVSQSMMAFKDKPLFSRSDSQMGPITKIRQKTERSLPMSIKSDLSTKLVCTVSADV